MESFHQWTLRLFWMIVLRGIAASHVAVSRSLSLSACFAAEASASNGRGGPVRFQRTLAASGFNFLMDHPGSRVDADSGGAASATGNVNT
ncbi:unnamed protein product [Macrosiphum euphorbiae]|uniref:Secreted protein n=1 Tax=Macrosiphum euphorbiae TaxID=13131 RepID=A0AAV0WUX0_9HEMI|nr:unnamed protein product [Macrosiphum euphorbiae]